MLSKKPNFTTLELIKTAKNAKNVSDLLPKMHSSVEEENNDLLETILQNKYFRKKAEEYAVSVSDYLNIEAGNLSYQADTQRYTVYQYIGIPTKSDKADNISVDIRNNEPFVNNQILPVTKKTLDSLIPPQASEVPKKDSREPQGITPNFSIREEQIMLLYPLVDALESYEAGLKNLHEVRKRESLPENKLAASELKELPAHKKRKVTPESLPEYQTPRAR
ncbi:MAG: hypothetical protein PQ612_02615 [Rickettsiales bacterium]|nr:hypothetical protein [Pseudomonadota bacterium]MDA0965994.1 hypothetical protein [Pseudomonadota bacterium]MDG4542535.1 hypothetical protein [Rickettsiales bacterium]MDG4545039.1 hypothetical protein [Rickettsiales bacterium]MDG4547162.1 hypothetical protein [Rickettsiales bacterium]